MSVAALLGAADVTEADFAAEYADLDACLADAYERLTARLDAAVRAGCSIGVNWLVAAEIEWPVRVRGGLEALLAELADNPKLARALTRAYPALGPAQQARYQAFVESFAPQFRAGRELAGVEAELPDEVEMLAVGAAEAIVFEEIAAGRTEQLPTMGSSILFSILVPFLGPGAAAEAERAQESG